MSTRECESLAPFARSLTLYRNFMHFGPDEYGFVAVAPRRVIVDLCGRFVSPIDRAVHPRIAEKCPMTRGEREEIKAREIGILRNLIRHSAADEYFETIRDSCLGVCKPLSNIKK